MSPAPYRVLTLAIHPSSKGFGWAAFSGPLSPYGWGTVDVRGAHKNEKCLQKIEKLLTSLKPQTIVLETFEPGQSDRRTRITRLGRAIAALAAAQSIDVAIYRYKDVRGHFGHMGVNSRWDIAATIARQFPGLAHLLPRKRKAWDAEHWRMALFSAVALVMTHYQRDAATVLEGLAPPDSSF